MSENESSKKLFAVHVFSGREKLVKQTLEKRIQEQNLGPHFGQIYVFTEEVMEIKAGQKRKSERNVYPGYVFIEIDMTEPAWYLVKETPNVIGFIGAKGDTPVPIPDSQAAAMLDRMKTGSEKPKPKVLYQPGEVIRVTEGPFADFNGVVEEVNYEKNRLRVAVLIFGRSTPVELEFGQVTKA